MFSGCGAEPNLACNDDNSDACNGYGAGHENRAQLAVLLTAGNTYLIRIAGFGYATGEYVLEVRGCSGPVEGDYNGDSIVDFGDFAWFADLWLYFNLKPKSLCSDI